MIYVFGFIVAATFGCAAGSVDLTEGMFRHLVITGRSRLALYLARIPAGLAIVVPLVAAGFTIVCSVCVFAAPTRAELRRYERARRAFALRIRELGRQTIPDRSSATSALADRYPVCPASRAAPTARSSGSQPGLQGPGQAAVTPAQLKAAAILIARQDYTNYSSDFLYPSDSLMIRTGLWIELEAVIGFIVGLGLASLLGQRTVPVILMIVLEIILTPLFSRVRIAHLLNLQRSIVGVAMAHLAPGGLPVFGGGGGGPSGGQGNPLLVPESVTWAALVIIAWLVGWTVLGAWRMMTRDA